mgnify:CR=1 FL=1
MYPKYIESLEIGKDNFRLGIATSINPKTFGEISVKGQESGTDHNKTIWKKI